MALYVNGKQISGGSGGNTNSIELTYAEYQALTPEQQLDGTEYFITDINGDGQQFQPICYSEEEREIGVWIDGKPLYEKTVSISPTSLSHGTTIAHGISNVDTVVWLETLMIRSSNRSIILPYAPTSNAFSGFYADRTNIIFTGGDTWQSTDYSNLYATIRYTKITDQAGSGTWTPQGVPAVHYSEDEQVVGTWIDGSTLYEKTLIFNNVQVTQSDSTSGLVHNVSNIGSFKRVTEAYVDFSGGQNWIPAIDTITSPVVIDTFLLNFDGLI